ncbi:MAG: class I SAM-dependent methyltransferase [Spirochaeta sp.]|jgi:SAM-dependent methyltransferase|nr:class I SAM-dependent methyltransferase [Spirochaeta sp.]
MGVKQVIKKLIPTALQPAIKWSYMGLRAAWYSGATVHCPCCGTDARAFLPGGYNRRPNVKCARCDSSGRHRLLSLYLRSKTNLYTDTLKVLHVAPELTFQHSFLRQPNLDYLSADLRSPRAQIKMDITDIQFPDSTFDVVLCSHVLEHVPDDLTGMTELRRVLKPTGWAILQVPIDRTREQTYEDSSITTDEGRRAAFGHHDHRRTYGLDYEARLRAAGFDVTADDFAAHLNPEEIQRYGIRPDETIYRCAKDAG